MPTDPAPPRTGSAPSQRARLRRGIVAAGVVLIVGFAASSVYDVWRSYRHSLAATDRELTNLSRALGGEAAHSFQAIDALLRDTANWYKANFDKITPERAQESLENLMSGVLSVRELFVADAQGMLRYSSRTSPTPVLDVSDLSRFIAQPDGAAAGLYISDPIVTGVDKRMELVLSRRLDHNGRFAGTVSALVDLDDFQQFYRAIDLGAGNTIVLLRDDSMLVAREPPAPDAVGRRFPSSLGRAISGRRCS